MSRRIDIELTSVRDDQTWTWRAAGAKQPKGVVASSLVPAGASVGDVLRAEVETTLDGTEVLAVTPPKAKKEQTDRIEIIGRTLSDDQLVTTTLAPKRGGNRRDRGERGDRDGRGDRPGRGRGDRRREGEGRPGGERPRAGGGRSGGERPDGDRRPRGPREGGDRRPRTERPAPPSRPKAKRLRPARTHRKAALETLAPEEQVIAEHLLRGGVPAVRQAVEKQNEQAKAEGRPLVKADVLLAIAERLYPALRVAEWRDRAEAAVADLDELDLRDLRSVVVAAEVGARDDESRALAEQIKEGLARRVDAEQNAWLAEISETLEAGRVVRALRLSSRPPKAGAPLPAELATKLAEAASGALTADTVPDRWATVLDALSFSPVRLQVTPASKPDSPSEELVAVVTRVASRLPNIAQAFGIAPPADAGRRRGPRGGRGRSGEKAGGPPRPPKPPKPVATEPAEPAEPTGAAGDGAPAEPAAASSESPAPEAAGEAAPPAGEVPDTTAEAAPAPPTDATPPVDAAPAAEADRSSDAAPPADSGPGAETPDDGEGPSPAPPSGDDPGTAPQTDDASGETPEQEGDAEQG